jgi:hypothetical protein
VSLLLVLAPLAAAQDHTVLMLGNSYTAYNDLPARVEEALEPGVATWEDVLTQGLSQGGLQLRDHLAKTDGTEGDTPWREALVTGDTLWQHVVLQEQSQIPGFDDTSPDLQESWEAAAALDALIAAHGAETVFLMTWGRRDGDSQNDHIYPDFSTMQDRLTAGYLTYVDQLSTPERPVWVIPAGLAWQTVHDDLVAAGVDPTDGITLFTQLYVSDGSHPTIEGSVLIAATALAALTGRSPVGLPAPEGIDAENLALLQDAAARTVFDDAHGEIDYPWAWTWAEWEAATEDPTVITQDALRPWVRVETFGVTLTDASVTDARLQLVEGSGLGAFGTLALLDADVWIDGGSLVVEDVTLGAGARIELRGGSLVGTLLDGASVDSLAVTGGQLLISTIDGDLVQEGGELVAGQAMAITGDWTLGADAGFLLEGPQGQVTVEGDVVLAGQLRLQNGSVGNGEAVVVVDAASIDLATTDIDLDQAWELSLESGGLGQRLVLLPPAGLGADTDPDTGDDTVGTDTDSCGCAAPAPTLAWLWLLAPWWHRRR